MGMPKLETDAMTRLTIVAVVVIAVVALGAAVFLFSAPSAGQGSISIGFTDAPVQGVTHIYITISNIMLQGTGDTSVSYSSGTQFDLLGLLNVTKMLGTTQVPAGNYTMIRFTLASAVATIASSNVTLKVPSGEIKVPVSFQIKSGATTSIVLDISADMTNISASGNLRPVVTVKSINGP
jgi:hypothetical protein